MKRVRCGTGERSLFIANTCNPAGQIPKLDVDRSNPIARSNVSLDERRPSGRRSSS